MIIKTKEELKGMKTAAKINGECLQMLKSLIRIGIAGDEIDAKAEEFYKKNNVIPAFKGYRGYPAVINFMINDQVVHCIPSKNQIVADGDIVSIDTGCIWNGYYADQAISLGVGNVSEEDQKLLNIAQISVEAACKKAMVGNTVGDLGYTQQAIIEMAGFSVVREFVGHEIGRNLHDSLRIPAYGRQGKEEKLVENLVLCIENQVCAKSPEIYIDKHDGWSTYTKDGCKCATFEHTVIVRKNFGEVITF